MEPLCFIASSAFLTNVSAASPVKTGTLLIAIAIIIFIKYLIRCKFTQIIPIHQTNHQKPSYFYHQSSITHPLVRQPRPRRLDNRTMCVKHSQYYCVKLHEQPRRGESLFASTEQPVYRLSPHLLRRGGFRRGCGTSPSRRGRVR